LLSLFKKFFIALLYLNYSKLFVHRSAASVGEIPSPSSALLDNCGVSFLDSDKAFTIATAAPLKWQDGCINLITKTFTTN